MKERLRVLLHNLESSKWLLADGVEWRDGEVFPACQVFDRKPKRKGQKDFCARVLGWSCYGYTRGVGIQCTAKLEDGVRGMRVSDIEGFMADVISPLCKDGLVNPLARKL